MGNNITVHYVVYVCQTLYRNLDGSVCTGTICNVFPSILYSVQVYRYEYIDEHRLGAGRPKKAGDSTNMKHNLRILMIALEQKKMVHRLSIRNSNFLLLRIVYTLQVHKNMPVYISVEDL